MKRLPHYFVIDPMTRYSVDPETGCWNWSGPIQNGYGRQGNWFAHRLVWLLSGRELTDGLVLDHLCRNRACCNPDHLELVSDRENLLRGHGGTGINSRKTHCIRGHEFTEENTYTNKNLPYLRRVCRICRLALTRKYAAEDRYHRKKHHE